MKIKLIRVLFGGVAILGVVAFLLNLNKNVTPNTSEDTPDKQFMPDLQEVVSQVGKAGTPQAPANWKVYKSENLDLTFKYPPNLLFQNTQDGLNIYYDTLENRAYVKNPNGYESNRPGMFIVSISPVQDLDAYIKEKYSELESQWKYSTATLFGQKAIVFTGQGMDRWDLILFTHNNTLYEVTIAGGAPNDEMRSNYYKMLSSFSFGE